jgi:HTH-type transcriptional regulator, competence development regulator
MAQPAFGLMLQHLRTERNFSLRELGVLADLDHAYIYRLETGDKESPSEEALAKLLRALKAARREADMLRFLAQHSQTDPALVSHILSDPTVTYEVFQSVAGAAFRGAVRPDYPKLIARVRRILDEEEENG